MPRIWFILCIHHLYILHRVITRLECFIRNMTELNFNWNLTNPRLYTVPAESTNDHGIHALSYSITMKSHEGQGFRAMGLSVQYWPRWFQDFPAIWLAVPFGANGAHLRICTLLEKSFLCVKWVVSVRKKFFPKENSSCEVFMVTNCPYAGINKWMEKSYNFWNNGTCGNTMVKPQTVRCWLIK